MLTLVIITIATATLLAIAFKILETWANQQKAQDNEIRHLKSVIDHDHDAIRALRHDVDHQQHDDQWGAWTKPLNPDKDSHSAFDEKP